MVPLQVSLPYKVVIGLPALSWTIPAGNLNVNLPAPTSVVAGGKQGDIKDFECPIHAIRVRDIYTFVLPRIFFVKQSHCNVVSLTENHYDSSFIITVDSVHSRFDRLRRLDPSFTRFYLACSHLNIHVSPR